MYDFNKREDRAEFHREIQAIFSGTKYDHKKTFVDSIMNGDYTAAFAAAFAAGTRAYKLEQDRKKFCGKYSPEARKNLYSPRQKEALRAGIMASRERRRERLREKNNASA